MKGKQLCLWMICMALALSHAGIASAQVYAGQRPPADWAEKDVLRLMQIDTNRSDCALIEVGGMSMLIDGGYAPFTDHVMDVLSSRGLNVLSFMLNSHPHDDHIVTTTNLLRKGIRAELFMSPFEKDYNDPFQRACVEQLDLAGIPYYQLKDWDVITMGNAQITVRTLNTTDMNSRSALLIVQFGECRALFMGDLTRGPQQQFLSEMGAGALKADVVKAPHHGITFFDVDFLNAVAPGAVVIPNKYSAENQIGSQCRSRRIPAYFSGDGDVVMECDGVDWYVYQLPHAQQ